jgi:carboxymethylenebutenolidase
MTNVLATKLPELGAAVPFYGIAPPLEDVPAIRAPLLLHFAQDDERINASWPPYQRALQAAHVRHEAYVYAGTQHGFNNDTTPRYDAPAAKLAWQRTIAFLNNNLRGHGK